MGKSRESGELNSKRREGSFPSPSSSSSSEFEFTISLSPSSRRSFSNLCPADELFYKGQLLPLHLSPRISMVRTLLLASSSTSSSSTDTNTTSSRDSNGSSSSYSSSSSSVNPAELLLLRRDCDSSRPSSVTEEEAQKAMSSSKRSKYFSSFSIFSSVFHNRGGSKKDVDIQIPAPPPTNKRTNSSAKQVIKKYVKKVKPLYEKLSTSQNKNQNQNQNQNHSQNKKKTFSFSTRSQRDTTLISTCKMVESMKKLEEDEDVEIYPQSHSFSGNLRFPGRKRCVGSCPSSIRSSPTHSGLLCIGGFPTNNPSTISPTSSSSMEELQNAIQGAIAHCKSSMIQSNQKDVISVN